MLQHIADEMLEPTSVERKILQALEGLNVLEKSPNGGRRISQDGQRYVLWHCHLFAVAFLLRRLSHPSQ